MDKKIKNPEIRFKGFSDDWCVKTAEFLCSISTGKNNTQDKIEGGKYPFYVRSLTIERSNNYLFDEEAVLTVGDGVGTGKVYHYVNGKYDLHQRVYRMFDFKELSGKYFYYYFSNNFHKRVTAMTAKSSVDSVRMEMISNMDIIYPRLLDEQNLITSFFQNLDNLITLHQKKYNKLVILKKAMLVKMFPKKGTLIPEIRFKGFTEDWEEKLLADEVDFFTGLTYSPRNVVKNGGTLVLRSSNVKNSQIVLTDNVYVDSDVVNCENVIVGDIIIVVRNGSRNLIGKHALIKKNMPNTVIGAFMTGIHSKQSDFINSLLDTNQFEKEIEKNLGATINQITTGAFKKMTFCFPNEDEQQQIGKYFQNLDNQIELHKAQLEKLNTIKKACFSKMFVGQD